MNVAVTDVAAVGERMHVDVPLQAPDQPANVEPEAAVAVSVTCVPLGKVSLHVDPQLMPVGALVTVPVPLPASTTVSWTGGGVAVKVAPTVVLAVRFTTHAPVPVQAPVQPPKAELVLTASVSVTDVPLAKLAVQVVGQLMPAGLLRIVPLPAPLSVTVSVICGGVVLNVAVTLVLALRVTAQVPVPVQAPDQPAKVEPVLAAAVNVTGVPLAKLALQMVPQLIPAGILVTAPAPVPPSATVSVICGGAEVKVAVTLVLALRVTTHAPVPVQAPDQPVKVEPVLAAAVNVTGVPLAKLALQVVPQLIPAGLLLTVPAPVPALCTVN